MAEQLTALTERLDSIMGNSGDLRHFLNEVKEEKELTREKIRECNEKSLKL